MRATTSVPPPAPNPTRTPTGLAGQSSASARLICAHNRATADITVRQDIVRLPIACLWPVQRIAVPQRSSTERRCLLQIFDAARLGVSQSSSPFRGRADLLAAGKGGK